jgi:hypothetical protein
MEEELCGRAGQTGQMTPFHRHRSDPREADAASPIFAPPTLTSILRFALRFHGSNNKYRGLSGFRGHSMFHVSARCLQYQLSILTTTPLGSLSCIQSSAFLSSLKVDFLVQGIHSFTPVKGASRHLSQRPGFQFGHCGHEFSATFSVLHLPGCVVILASYSFSNFKGPSEYSSQTV